MPTVDATPPSAPLDSNLAAHLPADEARARQGATAPAPSKLLWSLIVLAGAAIGVGAYLRVKAQAQATAFPHLLELFERTRGLVSEVMALYWSALSVGLLLGGATLVLVTVVLMIYNRRQAVAA